MCETHNENFTGIAYVSFQTESQKQFVLKH